MKIASAAILIALFSILSFAQGVSSIERDFEKSRPKLKMEKFTMGEDASSGYDYIIFTDKTNVVKIRSIWTSNAGPAPSVEDYYFKDGALILYSKMPARKNQVKELVKGRSLPLTPEEKLYLKDAKLTTWIEKGKTIPDSDARWQSKEKEVLESAKSELENYQSMKAEKAN